MWKKLWPLSHLCGLYLDSLHCVPLLHWEHWTPLSRCSFASAGQRRSALLSTWTPRSLSAELPCTWSVIWAHEPTWVQHRVLISCRDHPCPEDVAVSHWDKWPKKAGLASTGIHSLSWHIWYNLLSSTEWWGADGNHFNSTKTGWFSLKTLFPWSSV